MESLSSIFDITLLATIGLIFGATMVGAYFRSTRRDPCLKSFENFHVTLERSGGKIVWGIMELETTGLELLYRDTVQDANHIESSYVLYADEYGDIQAIYRYADDLTEEHRRLRLRHIQRSFHPGPLRRLSRGLRRFIEMASESLNEVFGLLIGRLRRPAGRYISESGEVHLRNIGTTVIGRVGYAHDPLLERYVGQKVVVEILEGEDEVHEHVGIFKNYSPDFVEILDVQYPERQSLEIGEDGCLGNECVTATMKDDVMRVTNNSEQPVLLQSLLLEDAEQLLNVVVDGGETVELHPEKKFAKARLNLRVVRELDLIVPRTRCVIRHRAERYKAELMEEIIFDLGVALRISTKAEAQEEKLRKILEHSPYSALEAANLGSILMQRQEFEEAEKWLKMACRFRYSLPDNGRRAQMLLAELARHRGKQPGGAAVAQAPVLAAPRFDSRPDPSDGRSPAVPTDYH